MLKSIFSSIKFALKKKLCSGKGFIVINQLYQLHLMLSTRSGNFHWQPRLRFAHLKPNMSKGSNQHQGLRGRAGCGQ